MDAVIRGTTMPVLEVHLTPGESVVAEAGQLGWFDDGIELETTTGARRRGRHVGRGEAQLRRRHLLHDALRVRRRSPAPSPSRRGCPARSSRCRSAPAAPISSSGTASSPASRAPSSRPRSTPATSGSGLLGGFGFLLQKLEGAGHAWVELAGELSEYDLQAGQTLRVHPAHVGVVEESVEYELTTVPGIKNKLFGGDGLFLLRLTGPGKVWLQSMSLPMLAHALAPYLPQPNGTAQTASLQGAAISGGLAAAAKGLAKLL